jgi:hypothetical protein
MKHQTANGSDDRLDVAVIGAGHLKREVGSPTGAVRSDTRVRLSAGVVSASGIEPRPKQRRDEHCRPHQAMH